MSDSQKWSVRFLEGAVDGDTVKLIRRRILHMLDGLVVCAEDQRPIRVRLVHVDTPERGEYGWAKAREDLNNWLEARPLDSLLILDAGSDGFGRRLVDLQDVTTGETASLHMIAVQQWPVWTGKS